MAASLKDLQELHRSMTKSLRTRIDQDLEDNLPTDAATLGVVAKFLKDNNISADPAEADDLDDLRAKFTEQQAARKAKRKSALADAAGDITIN